MDTWITKMCRKVYVSRIVAWMCVVAAVVGVGLLNKRYLANFFGGPYPVSESDLATLQNPDAAQHYFVRVFGSKVVDTGLQEVNVRTDENGEESREVSARYFALEMGPRYLLVKSSSKPAVVVVGAIRSVPPEVWQHMFRTPKDRQQQQRYFLPELLDASNFRLPGYIGLVVAGAALSLAVFFGLKQWQILKSPDEMPVARRVQSWGSPLEISVKVEREFKDGVRLKLRSLRMTDNYAIFLSLFTFQIYRLEDLLWSYKRVTRHSWNFIPTGKTYNAHMVFHDGNLDVKGSAKKVDSILAYAAGKAPWAIRGYSNETRRLLRGDRAGFCRAIEERRQKGDWHAS